jgi:2-C-methyl-D-erythritol 4-phosphate cytidylyltransferase
MKNSAVAVILAGGTGERMNETTPKQFLELDGKPVIIHTLGHFEKSILISSIVVVCHEDYMEGLDELIKQNNIKKACRIVRGGKTRQESAFIGIKNCPPGTEIVLIHDAVRPFVDESIIRDTLSAAEEAGAAGAAINVSDTIIIKKGDFIEKIPDRGILKRIQTPQGFRYKAILKAHQWALENGITDSTDDCGLVLAMGGPVKLVKGSTRNMKITDQADLFLAESLARSGKGQIEKEGDISG